MWAEKAKVGRSAVVILKTLTSLLWFSSYFAFLSVSTRNVLPDFGSEVMAEALAQRALVKPVYTIPIIPLSSSNQYRHQDHLDMKDYKKVRTCSSGIIQKKPTHFPPFSSVSVCVCCNRMASKLREILLTLNSSFGWVDSLKLLNAVLCIGTLSHTRPWHFHSERVHGSKWQLGLNY